MTTTTTPNPQLPTPDDWITLADWLGDNLLIRRLEAPDVSAGGLHLPAAEKKKLAVGTVLRVGLTSPPNFHAGDTILFAAFDPIDLPELDPPNHTGQTIHATLKAEAVIAILPPKE